LELRRPAEVSLKTEEGMKINTENSCNKENPNKTEM
jgi:hypothetical protein